MRKSKAPTKLIKGAKWQALWRKLYRDLREEAKVLYDVNKKKPLTEKMADVFAFNLARRTIWFLQDLKA